jgi:nucleoside-diphosphate-sugar epimerase
LTTLNSIDGKPSICNPAPSAIKSKIIHLYHIYHPRETDPAMAASPPPSNGKTVLITGLNGYIASHIGLELLSQGYTLRGTTRRPESLAALLNGPYSVYHTADRVKIFSVPDMTIPGAFDAAAQGVHGILHTASPVSFSLTLFEAVVGQAKAGTTVLLDSALKAGPQLTNLVVTSSVAAVVDMAGRSLEDEYVFTEMDFGKSALERAEREYKEGGQTPSGVLYNASKTAAEAEVWKFRNSVKVSRINPFKNPSFSTIHLYCFCNLFLTPHSLHFPSSLSTQVS